MIFSVGIEIFVRSPIPDADVSAMTADDVNTLKHTATDAVMDKNFFMKKPAKNH
jgi:hypothetical protein